jgi:two-component system OmpR family sensor kinase
VADIAPMAQSRRIDMGVPRADEGALSGHADALRILIRNLLENAVKYTPEGGRVDVEVIADAGRMLLSVEDSGPGIPDADRERVLDRFYRIAGSGATGSGLGLAIVKSITELHGGSLTLSRSERLGGLRVAVHFGAAG